MVMKQFTVTLIINSTKACGPISVGLIALRINLILISLFEVVSVMSWRLIIIGRASRDIIRDVSCNAVF